MISLVDLDMLNLPINVTLLQLLDIIMKAFEEGGLTLMSLNKNVLSLLNYLF